MLKLGYQFYISETKDGEAENWQEIKLSVDTNNRFTLDESLDSAKMFEPFSTREKPYQPFTKFKMEIYEVTETVSNRIEEYAYIGTDVVNRTLTLPNGTDIYEHTFSLIEITKSTERYIINTLDYTNVLNKQYASGIATTLYNASEDVSFGGDTYEAAGTTFLSKDIQTIIPYTSPKQRNQTVENFKINLNSITIAVSDDPEDDITVPISVDGVAYASGYVIRPDGTRQDLSATALKLIGGSGFYFSCQIINNVVLYQTGTYEFHMQILYDSGGTYKVAYNIANFVSSYQDSVDVDDWEFIPAVQRMLKSGKQRTSDQTQKYSLNPSAIAKFDGLKLPEMTITKTNLWEGLQQLCAPFNLIPRVERVQYTIADWNVINFDEITNNTEVENHAGLSISKTKMQSIDTYATKLDSNISNVVNVGADGIKTISDPGKQSDASGNIYDLEKTTVTETIGTIITNDDAIFQTSKPIRTIKKVVVLGADITNYIYEATEYDVLSDTDDSYPFSKAYALKYSIGGKTISELSHLIEHIYDPAFSSPAIENIIENIADRESITLPSDYSDITAYIEYEAFDDVRMIEEKPYREDNLADSELFFNQNTNIVNSLAFGESQKSALARMGFVETKETFLYMKPSQIPKQGEILDGNYISSVERELGQYDVRATLELVPANKINEFIGIQSYRRLSEVATTGATAREMIYENNITFGDKETWSTKLSDAGIVKYLNTFNQDTAIKDYGNTAFVTTYKTYSTGDEVLVNLIMPLTRIGKGNSLVFSFNMDDNYSAGVNSVKSAYDTDLRVSSYVRYADYFGRFDKMDFAIGDVATTGSGTDTNQYVLPVNYVDSEDDAVAPVNKIVDFTIEDVDKGNREIIGFTYQINALQNRKDIVIGSGLQIRNCLVSEATGTSAKVYLLPNKLKANSRYVDLTGAVDKGTVAINDDTAEERFIEPVNNDTATTYKAWCVAFPDGELLIGENGDIAPTEDTSKIYINFTQKEIV